MARNVEVVRRLFDAVERRDLPGLLACYDEEVEIHEAPSLPYGGVYRGIDGAVRHVAAFQETWASYQTPAEYGMHADVMDVMDGGDGGDGGDGAVVAVFRHRAVDPGTGQRLDEAETALYRVRDGKIVRSQMLHYDTAALLGFLARARSGS